MTTGCSPSSSDMTIRESPSWRLRGSDLGIGFRTCNDHIKIWVWDPKSKVSSSKQAYMCKFYVFVVLDITDGNFSSQICSFTQLGKRRILPFLHVEADILEGKEKQHKSIKGSGNDMIFWKVVIIRSRFELEVYTLGILMKLFMMLRINDGSYWDPVLSSSLKMAKLYLNVYFIPIGI